MPRPQKRPRKEKAADTGAEAAAAGGGARPAALTLLDVAWIVAKRGRHCSKPTPRRPCRTRSANT